VRLGNGNALRELEHPSPQKRGPKPKVRPIEVLGRAENFQVILGQVWDRLWPLLSRVQSEDDVTKAFQEGARPYDREFVPVLSQLLIGVLKEATFPQRAKSMQRFIADSAAALGAVTARRSRDICAQERLAKKRAHRILRWEFFIECSCGYQGQSRNHGCPACGTNIEFPPSLGSNFF